MLVLKGHKLLIKPVTVEAQLDKNLDDAGAIALKKMGFEIAATKDQKKQYEAATEHGVVIAIGSMAWKDPDLGYGLDGWEPWAAVGDEILYVRYSGKFVRDPYGDTDQYYLINDVDVQCVVQKGQ